MIWYLEALSKYAVFSGRASRSEYWYFALFNHIAVVALYVIERILGLFPDAPFGILSALYSLFVLLPSLAVSIRRLHDTGRSGWWMLLVFIPLIGPLALLVFFLQVSQPGVNRFGPSPLVGAVAVAQPTTAGVTAASDRQVSKKTIELPKITPAAINRFKDRGVSLVYNYQGHGVNVGFGRGSAISDGDVPALAGLGLHELYLSRTGLSDESIAHFESMPSLRIVDLSHTKVSRDGIEHLKESLPDAKIIG